LGTDSFGLCDLSQDQTLAWFEGINLLFKAACVR
jgi:hypothetical protein